MKTIENSKIAPTVHLSSDQCGKIFYITLKLFSLTFPTVNDVCSFIKDEVRPGSASNTANQILISYELRHLCTLYLHGISTKNIQGISLQNVLLKINQTFKHLGLNAILKFTCVPIRSPSHDRNVATTEML